MLAEFAELAMERVRAASSRAAAVEAEGGDPSVHLIAFDRMGRALRLAISLRRRLIGEAQAEAGRHLQVRKERLRAALTPAIRRQAPFGERQDLDWALAHRLETEAETFASLSFEAGVARLTRMLGLPDEAPDDETAEAPPSDLQDISVDDFGITLTPDLVDRARRIADRATATGPPG